MQARCILDARARLGEGPLWDADQGVLYWVDILAPSLNRLDPLSGDAETWMLPEPVGSVALTVDGRAAVLAMRSGFKRLDFADGAVRDLAQVPGHDPVRTRFNDGKCDRRGRFFAGTMDDRGEKEAVGKLYRLDPDGTVSTVADGIVTSNGLGWSPDEATFYYTDTGTGAIRAYDWDLESGQFDNPRVFAEIPREHGRPDGLTVDSQGFVWSAHWDGWRITRYSPDGAVDRVIEMPVQRPTSCMFGGPDLTTLFVTSATPALDGIVARDQAHAGGVFAIETGIEGLREPRWGGR